jgi:signal transduction histidine kinase
VEVIAFRGIQQLLSNARDNLGSDKIEVILDVANNQVKAIVEANGRGFDPAVALDRGQGDSPLQNLLDLRERVELVGGTLEIFSTEEEEGSRIEIILPYSA